MSSVRSVTHVPGCAGPLVVEVGQGPLAQHRCGGRILGQDAVGIPGDDFRFDANEIGRVKLSLT
jgi:hypothetical protein